MKPVLVWRRNFVKKFTLAEQTKIVKNPQGIVWWLLLMDIDQINLVDLIIIGDIQGLVSAGCITQERAIDILSV